MLKDWLREKYRVGDITDRQMQAFYEAVGLTRSLLLQWIYDDYQPDTLVIDKMLVESRVLGFRD